MALICVSFYLSLLDRDRPNWGGAARRWGKGFNCCSGEIFLHQGAFSPLILSGSSAGTVRGERGEFLRGEDGREERGGGGGDEKGERRRAGSKRICQKAEIGRRRDCARRGGWVQRLRGGADPSGGGARFWAFTRCFHKFEH